MVCTLPLNLPVLKRQLRLGAPGKIRGAPRRIATFSLATDNRGGAHVQSRDAECSVTLMSPEEQERALSNVRVRQAELGALRVLERERQHEMYS
jgi:hypothetical protein